MKLKRNTEMDKVLRDNPQMSNVLGSLVHKEPITRSRANRSGGVSASELTGMSKAVSERNRSLESVMEIFPDLELCVQILVSSVLAPKDMVQVDLLYKVGNVPIPNDLKAVMLSKVSEYISDEYNIESLLPTLLRECLFEKGSYILAVLPESTLDSVIQKHTVSVEDMGSLFTPDQVVRSTGILGPPNNKPVRRTGMESFSGVRVGDVNGDILVGESSLGIQVTDNSDILKLPSIIHKNDMNKVSNMIYGTPSMESVKLDQLYRSPTNEKVGSITLKVPDKQDTSGNKPVVMKLPSESVIPVHVPGDPETAIGYFVLLDVEGHPVTDSTMNGTTTDPELEDMLNSSTNSMSGLLLTKVKRNLQGASRNRLSLKNATDIFADIVETDLKNRLVNGVYGSAVGITSVSEIYRVMLARTLQSMSTRLLYIPVELVSYFAYKRYNNGIGRSLMDDTKILSSLRAMMLFAKVMSLVKSSISTTMVDITLDPDDPDPAKTIETATGVVLAAKQGYFPLGIETPSDLVDWLHVTGYEFTFSGHPGLPETKLDFTHQTRDHQQPDEDLEETLRKQTIMAMGLTPEMVDSGFDADFATTVVNNNILLSKRVMQIQDKITPTLTEHIRKLVRSDNVIRQTVNAILVSKKKEVVKHIKANTSEELDMSEEAMLDWVTDKFITGITVTLPRPDNTSVENLSEAYNNYKGSLEDTIEAFINDDMMDSELVGDVGEFTASMVSVLTNHFLRKWCADNNYLPELSTISMLTEEGDPNEVVFDENSQYMRSLMANLTSFIKNMSKVKRKADKVLDKLEEEPEEDETDDVTPEEDETDDVTPEDEPEEDEVTEEETPDEDSDNTDEP